MATLRGKRVLSTMSFWMSAIITSITISYSAPRDSALPEVLRSGEPGGGSQQAGHDPSTGAGGQQGRRQGGQQIPGQDEHHGGYAHQCEGLGHHRHAADGGTGQKSEARG
ncbi:hypothetical protein E2C01_081900 [Portunus trituberculatus]|uniref:Uncharacterized protein n=1 Tax=Portunus trituberculatus TaxID=210409 RepID=A0A5B7IT30_PORTR|nr:hypothetical protein [Portunus trituberculatus]